MRYNIDMKTILHCDANNFYASVECMGRRDLQGVPVAVCGDPQKRHGIILAKNDLAKKAGVKTAETIRSALNKCPELKLVEPHFEKYVAVSDSIFDIYNQYTDLVEPFGIDEGWLDVTPSVKLFGDGVKIADRIQLPPRVKDFIVTHHGKSKTKYFYNSFKNKYPDKEIKEELFTYPGPNPRTKETAILMMADSVEAASRSLKEYTEASISQLVENIINGQMMDNLLKDTPLSFRDIETIKQVFIEKLKTIYHTRISYPELKV